MGPVCVYRGVAVQEAKGLCIEVCRCDRYATIAKKPKGCFEKWEKYRADIPDTPLKKSFNKMNFTLKIIFNLLCGKNVSIYRYIHKTAYIKPI